jgi:NAD(P)-dependent dehydrogenase (short-subunit alcohol dehydrogenase family)
VSFEGRVALVTGAGTGIGAASAMLLAERGAAVGLVGRRREPLELLAERIRAASGRALVAVGDVSVAEDSRRIVDAVVAEFGGLQHAVNNAGIGGNTGKLTDVAAEEWDEAIAVNLSGVFYGMKYQIPAIIAAGGGSIVNVSSVFVDRAGPAPYTAAKAGIRGLTRSAAKNYAALGVRVNEVEPGVTESEMTAANPEGTARLAANIPMARLALPDELARAIAFLLSDDASYVTGAHLAVDGGFLA